MKRCCDCGREKPLAAYNRKPDNRDGRKSYCAECERERSRRWYARNRERHLANTRSYAKANPALRREIAKRHYKRTRGAAQRRFRERHPERIAEAQARWESNPENRREKYARRRARELRAFVAPVDGAAIFERDQGLCGICGEAVDATDWHLDHVIPLSRGGTHEPANVQVSHPACNLRKWANVEAA